MENPNPRLQSSPSQWEKLAPQARRMRRVATAGEDRLWHALRRGAVNGLKFRRQHAIGRFIVDFYCVKAQLAVEVDGPVHARQMDADRERQAYLEALGLTVLRFSNDEVMNHLPRVVSRIERVTQIE